MATRLVSPYPLVWSTGLARAGVGCRGAVSDQVLAGRRAGRGWGPRSTAGAGFGILADLILAARGVRGATKFLPTELVTSNFVTMTKLEAPWRRWSEPRPFVSLAARRAELCFCRWPFAVLGGHGGRSG